MQEFMRLLWLVVFGIGVVALLLLCDAMLPGLLARTRQTLVAMPWRSFLVGLVNGAFFGLLSAALLAPGGGIALIGGTFATILLALVAVGLAAAARIVGERLRPAAADPVRQFVLGAGVLTLASAVPLVGWFVVLPFAGLAGLGALLIAIVQRRPAAAMPSATPAPPPWDSGAPLAQGGDARRWP
jgi:hypothetical protein